MAGPTAHTPAEKTLVIALGGNTIARDGDDGSIEAQYARATEATRAVCQLALSGFRIALTHGNGPVVGNIVMRGELARHEVPPMPLFIADADSQGGIGLMLQQVLGNRLRELGSAIMPVSVVTQVVVDPADPAFSDPTKPIGMHYSREDATELERRHGWRFAEEPGRGWRRLVPSPRPLRIVESDAIRALLAGEMIPIAAGGGGVPVVESESGLRGVDAVIDKDWASAILADQIGADMLIVLMEADAVYEGWGTDRQRRIPRLTAAEARGLLGEGGLSRGSIAPKVEAAAWSAQRGRPTLICRYEDLSLALDGHAGTLVVAE